MRTVRLRVGGRTLALRGPEHLPALALPRHLAPFAVARGGDLRLDVTTAVPPVPPGPPLFDSRGPWRVHASGRRRLYLFRAPLGGGRRAALVDPSWRRGTLHLDARAAPVAGLAWAYPLHELAFAHHLARVGGLVLHASAVVTGGRAVLFCGHSGAGKTTLARLWRRARRGALVLSDDRVVVRRSGGRWRVWGTPWHGSGRIASPESRPLGLVCFIEQAARTEALPVEGGSAAAALMARTFPPPWDATAMARSLATSARLAEEVRAVRLRFRPRAEAVALVERLAGSR